MKLGTFTKQPRERISKSVFYTDALDDGDEIMTVDSVTVEPAGELTATPSLVSGDRVRLWVNGGVDGASYKVTIVVTTQGGEILEDEITAKVKEL